MNSSSRSVYILIFAHLYFIFHLSITAFCVNLPYIPSDNIALNCGSSSSGSPQYDGRNWTSDFGSEFVSFIDPPGTNSTTSSTSFLDPAVPEIPYLTARIFHTEFTYKFNVTPGWKFVRLHFYPSSYYIGMDASKAFLTATARSGSHTLLRNFSASLNAEYLKAPFLMKEFIVYVSGRVLDINFAPSSNDPEAFAFVNGIEVVSMPLNLYVRGVDEPGIFIVGRESILFYLDNTFSLETCHRVNVGGSEIPPKQDTGMLRSWTRDDGNLFGASSGEMPFDLNMTLRYLPNVPPYTAPENVYGTARSMGLSDLANLNYNMSWFFPVDSGFWYLIRLHFCEVDRSITKINQRVFDIFINNETAQVAADVIAWSSGYAVPVYQDYAVRIPKVNNGEKQDLWLDLHPNTPSKSQYYDSILNGVEIFKLSDNDGNLAGLNPPEETVAGLPQKKLAPKSPKKTTTFIIVGCLLGGGLLVFILCLVIFSKIIRERIISYLPLKFDHPKSGVTLKIQVSPLCHQFSINEIRAATSNFDEALVVGIGGFGKVYKGCFNAGATTIAVKRGNQMAEKSLHEFQTEIIMLSQLRHHNLVSLIGYCLEDNEMILVHEYMANGTLHDHLHAPKSSLTWEQRLKICIGAAKGLHYLHTGSKDKIIHRDIKSTNILIDENWVAKVSDFGLSKLVPVASSNSHVTTEVKGTSGYLDPEYYRLLKLTEKSDVYSFGVVLLEVLCAKPAMNPTAEEDEHVNLADWALSYYQNGTVDQIVDTSMEETIAQESLVKFVEIAKHCLAQQGMDRPPMAEVLWNLELSLQLQNCAGERHGPQNDTNVHMLTATIATGVESTSDPTPGIEFSEIMMPLGR